MDKLVTQHARPVESLADALALGGNHRDHASRTGANGVEVGQGNGPAAEHLMVVEDLDEDASLRPMVELLPQLGVNLLEVVAHKAGQGGVAGRVVAQGEMVGLKSLVLLEVFEDLTRVR